MKRLFTFFILVVETLFAGSVHILNDTPFPLTAEIFSADGNSKGKILINPQASSTWQDAPGGNYKWSQTPYRVIFVCSKTGSQYGLIDGIQQSAYIRASTASGPRDCSTNKNKEEKQSEQTNSQPQNIEPPGDPNWGPP